MKPTQELVNRFLDQLRESGKVNMFGAYPYVAEMFGLDKATARRMTAEWMRTFGTRQRISEISEAKENACNQLLTVVS